MSFKFLLDKKYNILFWMVYWFIQSLLMSRGDTVDFYLIKNIIIVGLQFLVVYFNFKWLFPRFFEKGKYALYVSLSIVLIYSVFSLSFVLIDTAFYLYYPNFSMQDDGAYFTTDFWRILSGSSFYSLALVCSLVYKLLKINKAKESLNVELKQQLKEDNNVGSVTINEGRKIHKVLIKDIYFIKGLKEYVVWHVKDKNIIVLQTMNSIEADYKDKGFLRVHKSYIINMSHVSSFKSNSLTIGNDIIPIGRTFKKRVSEFLLNDTVLK